MTTKEPMKHNPDDAAVERLTDTSLADALEVLKRRAWGLEAATSSLVDNCPDKSTVGVGQLAYDFATEMDRLAEAFAIEHALRRGEMNLAA
jgi:hypothetical protein